MFIDWYGDFDLNKFSNYFQDDLARRTNDVY